MMFNVVYLSAIEIYGLTPKQQISTQWLSVTIASLLIMSWYPSQPHYSLSQGNAPPGLNVAITEAITPINGVKVFLNDSQI